MNKIIQLKQNLTLGTVLTLLRVSSPIHAIALILPSLLPYLLLGLMQLSYIQELMVCQDLFRVSLQVFWIALEKI